MFRLMLTQNSIQYITVLLLGYIDEIKGIQKTKTVMVTLELQSPSNCSRTSATRTENYSATINKGITVHIYLNQIF